MMILSSIFGTTVIQQFQLLVATGHHDEGDTHPNADTSAWSAPGKFTKITAEEAANHLGMDTSYLTPEMCS